MYLETKLESSLNQDRGTDSGLMNSTARPVHFKLHLIYTNETELCVQLTLISQLMSRHIGT